jgi:hypothetical protein
MAGLWVGSGKSTPPLWSASTVYSTLGTFDRREGQVINRPNLTTLVTCNHRTRLSFLSPPSCLRAAYYKLASLCFLPTKALGESGLTTYISDLEPMASNHSPLLPSQCIH